MPTFTNPASDSGFVPRKEFIREQRTTANTFSLLAFAGPSCVRLYTFPIPVIHALRRLFDHGNLITIYRQDIHLNLHEFTLDGRPWSNPKSVVSEKLLIDILAIIFRYGYLFLSTIDYGRERDDRLAIAFSKPCFLPDASIRSGSPVPASPDPARSGSSTSHTPTLHKVAFALSFISTTRLRVISPPLDSTPAILQAVRASWPRGVVSEKKVAEATFEFKLKGYRWFQEDTFAADSLKHILSILGSLDAHSFSLLTSLSLSNRSRVKDLWIFTGPPSILDQETDSPAQSFDHTSYGDHKRVQGSNPEPHITSQTGSQYPQHRRYATSPTLPRLPHSPTSHVQHGRSATDGSIYNVYTNHDNTANDSPAVAALRKATPRAPVGHGADDKAGYRVALPNTPSNDAENMTGVGTVASNASWRGRPLPQPREVIYEAPPEVEGNLVRTPSVIVTGPDPSSPIKLRSPSPSGPRPLQPVSSRAKTPPLLKSSPSSPVTTTANVLARTPSQSQAPPGNTPTSSAPRQGSTSGLLSPGVFRDSEFSGSEDSVEIPIKWTGSEAGRRDEGGSGHKSQNSQRLIIPANRASPAADGGTGEDEHGRIDRDTRSNGIEKRAFQEVTSRVPLPDITHPAKRQIRSEVGSVGIIAPPASRQTPSPPAPSPVQSRGKGKTAGDGSMQGWVLVNIEGRDPTQSGPSPASVSSPFQPQNGTVSPMSSNTHGNRSAMSAPAKTIAMIDAVQSKSKTRSGNQHSSPSGLKRIFGLRSSTKDPEDTKPKARAKSRGVATRGDKRRLID